MFSDIITLSLSDGSIRMVHKPPLQQVKFFSDELKNMTLPANINLSEKLPTTEAEALDAFLMFLYFGGPPELHQERGTADQAKVLELFVKLYAIAHELGIETLQNNVLYRMRYFHKGNFLHLPCLQIVSRSLMKDTALLHFLTDQLTYDVKRYDLSRIAGISAWTLAGGGAVQKVFRLLCSSEIKEPSKAEPCNHHVHETTLGCGDIEGADV
jgi:hypothetical protein